MLVLQIGLLLVLIILIDIDKNLLEAIKTLRLYSWYANFADENEKREARARAEAAAKEAIRK